MNKEQATALRTPFPKESIGKLPKGGTMLDYVGHAAVTDRLLTVDPNWDYQIVTVDDSGSPLPGLDKGLWIKLTICGVTRYGYGDGPTIKERIGDAIRNAAMRFGVALDLWAKEDLVEFARHAKPSGAPAETDWAAEAVRLMGSLGITAKSKMLTYANEAAGSWHTSASEFTADEWVKVVAELKAAGAK